MTARNLLAGLTAALLPLVFLLAGCGRTAQAGSAASPAAAPAIEPGNPAAMGHEMAGMEPGTTESMSHEHMMGPHMRMTAPRPATAADRQRAAALVATLRTSLVKYKDYRVAVADGYKQFLPQVPQPMYHFTKWTSAVKAAFTFDPEHPTSLLYKKEGEGYRLVGAMYTAPRRLDEASLDERVPLSIARWHQHVNFCLPPRGSGAEVDRTKFGFAGSIATAEACQAAGGRFYPVVFGWMVHVYPFEEDPAKIWAH
jgi:hypothetical protein